MPINAHTSRSLAECLACHSNMHRIQLSTVASETTSDIVSDLSIVIPYYETGTPFRVVLQYLAEAICFSRDAYPTWRCELIVVDDGSCNSRASTYLQETTIEHVRLLELGKNYGRSLARNTGLACAQYPTTLFVDSDIVVTRTLLAGALRISAAATRVEARPSITCALFEFASPGREALLRGPLTAADLQINDFRESCTYQASWIGCDQDMEYVGQALRIFDETQNLKTFPSKFKAWVLPNMVLGGFFTVNTGHAVSVGGFDSEFSGYGFTETTLVTKLVSAANALVIPVVGDGAIHLEIQAVALTQDERNRRFRMRHDTYFNDYLRKDTSEACNRRMETAEYRSTSFRGA